MTSSKSVGMRMRIETDYNESGGTILRTLDGMDPVHRLDVLRALLAYETERVIERIEELRNILPLEDRP